MAEGLLRTRLAQRGIAAAVSSAGLSFDDRPATPEAVDAARAYGVDISAHRSRILTADMVEDAELVLGMERFHAREVMVLEPAAMERSFTLKELTRRATAIGARERGEPLPAWLKRAASTRRASDLLGQSPDDDVADPFRGSAAVYARCAAEIDDLVTTLATLGWPAEAEGAA
ncbi:MAG: protein-tyrosine phosphatase [Acidimicrobiaceae bacterium]